MFAFGLKLSTSVASQMSYIRLHFQTDPTLKEALLAMLSELPFEAFEEVYDEWLTGMDMARYDQNLKAQLVDLQQIIPFLLQETTVAKKNWNKLWTQNFKPIRIGDLVTVRAPFHEKTNDASHEIVIEPQMAFGTGHHETTQLMIRQMSCLHFENKAVLDYGAGTGILAILAEKMGAGSICALEIDEIAVENLRQNIVVNHSSRIQTIHGNLEEVKNQRYDIILVNITRNVILDSLDLLIEVSNEQADLIFSGFLEKDSELITKAMEERGGSLMGSQRKSGWVALLFQLSK